MDPLFKGLAATLRSHGLKVKAVKGWKTRGHEGTFTPFGVMFHHTASDKNSGNAPALGIVTHGRSDLPGPLCNFLVGRDGTIYFVASGRCDHAGEGGPLKGVPKDAGNTFLLGVECENDGVGETWPSYQKEAIAKLFAILLYRMHRGQAMCIAHREWTSRKIDPANINMDAFRNRVGKEIGKLKPEVRSGR